MSGVLGVWASLVRSLVRPLSDFGLIFFFFFGGGSGVQMLRVVWIQLHLFGTSRVCIVFTAPGWECELHGLSRFATQSGGDLLRIRDASWILSRQ